MVYCPSLDFFVVDGLVTEIKGYTTLQWEAKSASNPDVNVIFEKDIQPYLKYVIDKYGKDFIRLYE